MALVLALGKKQPIIKSFMRSDKRNRQTGIPVVASSVLAGLQSEEDKGALEGTERQRAKDQQRQDLLGPAFCSLGGIQCWPEGI